jgi:hypothetical protein
MPDKETLLVMIPSLLKKGADGVVFLEKAVRSILNQSIASTLAIDIAVGLDPGSTAPSDLKLPQTVRFFQSEGQSPAYQVNAASRAFDHSYVAILEDDDEWHPDFLGVAMQALKRVEFVSSTQLQYNAKGEIICIYDFPTPSGWVMGRKAWEAVGAFDESYRLHQDNEWLGRLAEAGLKRAHLVEATAPADEGWIMLRPWLNNVLTLGGPASRLFRHQSVVPLVRRLVHDASIMYAIRSDPAVAKQSQSEYARLNQRFGRTPW